MGIHNFGWEKIMHFVSRETFRTSFRNPACSSPTLVVILRWAQSSEKAFQILTSDNSLLPDKTILPHLFQVIWIATESFKNCWLCLDTFWKLWTFSWVSRFSLWKLVDYMDPAYNPAFILKVLDLIDNLCVTWTLHESCGYFYFPSIY